MNETSPSIRDTIWQHWNRRLSPLLRQRMAFLFIGNLILVGFIFYHTQQHEKASFLDELSRFSANVAPVTLAAIGLTGIIYAGSIDISVGSIIVVAGTVLGIFYEYQASALVCFAACFITAWSLSVLNGYLIRLLRLPAIIITLGGLAFYRGLALFLAQLALNPFSGQISVQQEIYHTPGKQYASLILLTVTITVILWEVFGKTPRYWLAFGCSENACRLKGISTGVTQLSTFFVGGLFLGLASLVEITNRMTIEPARMLTGFELDVIGAVVLGGTNIFGGEGSFVGTILGSFFLYWSGQAIFYLGISEYWRTAIQGAIILAVIGFDCIIHKKQKQLDELR